jgi:hypothetical protein
MKDLALPIEITGIQGGHAGGSWSLVVNRDYEGLLAKLGVVSFADLYDLAGGTIVKKQKDRSVLRFERGGAVFFLKRHEREKQQKGGRIPNSLFSWCSEGGKEFAFFHGFRVHQLATAAPVAMGEKVFADGTVQSFFLSEDYSPYVQLEDLIRHTPEVLAGSENQVKRLNILQAVGQYARRMHQAGFNHQDFNATHVLLHGFTEGIPAMALFDLQRVDQNPFHKMRWPIKALAEFNYSSRENSVFSDEERLFLFHVYRDKVGRPLNLYERVQYQWIEAKTKRIARHTAKRHARKRKHR